MYIVQAAKLIGALVELNIVKSPSAASPKPAIAISLILSPPSSAQFGELRGILPQPGARCIAVIVMPKLDDIMPFVTPQIALLVLGALVLLIVTVVLVTLALRD